jgi:hypothetical protein
MNIERFATLTQNRPHHAVSEKYRFIPTKEVLDIAADHGWFPANVQEARTRVEANHGFQKHIVRLRNVLMSRGMEFPEIVVVNSHLGSAAFWLLLGWFRCVCLNGTIVGDTVESHKIRHVGFAPSLVESAIKQILDVTPRVEENVNRFKAIEMTPAEQRVFAKAAAELRFDAEKVNVEPDQLLTVRRYDDKGSDLWTTFNRVQENVIRGGVRTRTADGRRVRSRAVTGVSEDVRLNRALWTLTEEFAKLKAA